MKFYANAYAVSNVGSIRNKNEDNYYLDGSIVDSSNNINHSVSKAKKLVCSVCDGMGGLNAGEIASKCAVKTIKKNEKKLLSGKAENINSVIINANELVCNEAIKQKRTMGSTVTLLTFDGKEITASNVGDSRIYQINSRNMKQISHDHTRAQLFIDANLPVRSESDHHALTQHLGINPNEMMLEPHIIKLTANQGDKYLLCSDGLTDMVCDKDILSIINENANIVTAGNKLIDLALKNGGEDNTTLILVEIV